MTRQEKLDWMINWAHKNKVILELEGSCGIGRDCVGITAKGLYPDYHWYDDSYEKIDENGDVWVPEDAYHKHECVAVLHHGENSEAQLYEWLQWFDTNNFTVEAKQAGEEQIKSLHIIEIMMGRHNTLRMVKQK